MTDELTVRIGTPDDIHGLMDLAIAATDENGLTNINPQKVLGEIWSSLNLHHGIIGVIGKVGEKPEAAILVRIEAMWYSDDLSVIERAIFVAPEFRAAKGGRATLLIKFAQSLRERLDLPLVIGILSSQRSEAKVRAYRRLLGEPSGAYWIVGGQTGHQKAAE